MMKFIINNRIGAQKTDVNLLTWKLLVLMTWFPLLLENTPEIVRVARQAPVAEPDVFSPLKVSPAPAFSFWTSSRHAVLCSAENISQSQEHSEELKRGKTQWNPNFLNPMSHFPPKSSTEF